MRNVCDGFFYCAAVFNSRMPLTFFCIHLMYHKKQTLSIVTGKICF